jgi:hypothetical protein
LTGVFSMRNARRAAGLNPDGEPLIPFRSPPSMRGAGASSYSFENWSINDPLPQYEDHVSGVPLSQPSSVVTVPSPSQILSDNSGFHFPFHPAFGSESVVKVRLPTGLHEASKDTDTATSESMNPSSGVPVDASSSSSRVSTSERPVIPTFPQDSHSDDGEDAPLPLSLSIVSEAPARTQGPCFHHHS